MAPRIKILISSGSEKGTWIYYPFLPSKSPGKRIPSRLPNGVPRERDTRLQRMFTSLLIYLLLSFRVPGKGAPSVFPGGSPRTGILRHQSHWPSEGILFIYLFIHSFIHVCLPESPKRSPHTYRKNIRSPSTEPHADGRPTYNGVRSCSLRGSLRTLLSLPQCHAAFGTIPSTLAWVDQSPIASLCRRNPHQGIPSTTVTASHVTQGRVEFESTIPQVRKRGWIYGRLVDKETWVYDDLLWSES